MDKVKEYNPKKHRIDINVGWLVTYKIDGVQVVVEDGIALSRAGKPLYNIPTLEDGTYECFLGSWEKSVSACRTVGGALIGRENFYRLDSKHIDHRLIASLVYDGSVDAVFMDAKRLGYEGLVLHGPDGQMLKVKDKQTYDVPVIGYQSGTGKHLGRMGALLTPKGKVGTGFTDKQREEWRDRWAGGFNGFGTVIEVECMELTPDGKFRHPRFVRIREDKTREMCD